MRILVLGNGFDLAHGLPTGADAFMNSVLKEPFDDKKYQKVIDELRTPDDERFLFDWLKIAADLLKKERAILWDGIENEISNGVKFWDEARQRAKQNNNYLLSSSFKDHPRCSLYVHHFGADHLIGNLDGESTIAIIRRRMHSSLEAITRALELYLLNSVQSIDLERLSFFTEMKPDKVINFNYTNTVERLYATAWGDPEVYHIHGQAQEDSTLNKCNMVFGIDEYQDKYDAQGNNYYIQFKKFYQRILKKTGSDYKGWLALRNNHPLGRRDTLYVDFYGHSLSIADGDVIRDLIMQENSITTIYYYDKDALGKIISNLVAILGEEELIEKTGAHNETIVFKEIHQK